MNGDVGGLHHIGLVVRDLKAALALYRRLGFVAQPPAIPALISAAGGTLAPLGAAVIFRQSGE